MDKFVLSLLVTEKQKLTIEALFNHNNWDFITVSPTKKRGMRSLTKLTTYHRKLDI
jgi:hypothetical protein